MAETVFKFPGFYGIETDLTARTVRTVGVPAGLIGTSLKGPAFVPVTVGSFSDFTARFGDVDSDFMAPYAAEKFLANRPALTFIRILGAGANVNSTDISNTEAKGIVVNAGFKIVGTAATDDERYMGCVQFLIAKHLLTGSEARGMPMFTDNSSFLVSGASDEVYLVRGTIFTANDCRIQILDHNQTYSVDADDVATANSSTRLFKMAVSTSQGATFGSDEGNVGIRIYTASLNPTEDNYFAKLLNTDPSKFDTLRHYLYSDYALDYEVASVHTGTNAILIASGTTNTSATSGDTTLVFRNMFGRFDTRFKTARTPAFISQPYGGIEYDLFHIESLDDGAYPNEKFKISISSLVASTNPKYRYGTFTVLVRDFEDTDLDVKIIEQFANCSLDPEADNYIAKVIGDTGIKFNFDVTNADDRRLVKTGKYPNKSRHIRVVMDPRVDDKIVPADALPFGFKGMKLLNTNNLLADITGTLPATWASNVRLGGSGSTVEPRLFAAIIPPIPLRFKITRGQVATGSGILTGAPGSQELTDTRFYWGVKFERNNGDILNPNINSSMNELIPTLTRFAGIDLLDAVITGSYVDDFCDNKFTLARVALGNTDFTHLTASTLLHMKEACYMRNETPDVTNYTITDSSTARLTLASLIHSKSLPTTFNKFSPYCKFTTCLYGGFDGLNILDTSAMKCDDRSTSTEARNALYGGAHATFTSPGFSTNQNGVGSDNNQVNSYKTAIDLMTDPMVTNVNLVCIPGQREPLVADYAAEATEDYDLALYLMDIPTYNSQGERVFDGETANTATYLSNENVSDVFDTRSIDNAYVSAYYPDVVIDDTKTGRKVTVPASIAALAAIGFNDKVAFPWFAPAGFNRAALSFVSLTRGRLKQADRELMYQTRINPIVKFPNEGYVIFSQKTLDANNTALDSINVQRMIMDVKRQIIDIGNRIMFEQISSDLRKQFVNNAEAVLRSVQNRGGLQKYKMICDETNNTALDEESNRINAKIFLLPVKAVEFIEINFIITRSGVSFSG